MRIPIMKPDRADFELMPKVVLRGKLTGFTARGLGIGAAFAPGRAFTVRVIPQEEIATAVTLRIGDDGCYPEIQAAADEKGILRFSFAFDREEVYTLRILGDGKEKLTDFKVFSAEKDLWERIPMKGNTHCHTCFSPDGHEDPVIAASVYRKAGYDYLAITDHHSTEGSVYAVRHMRDLPTGMSLFYGEEIHVPNAYIHAVSVGCLLEGGTEIDALYHGHEEEVKRIVWEIAESVKGTLPEGVGPYDYAWRKWIADTIHENGGIAVVAHPFWEYDANNTRNAMLKHIVRTRLFDAVEVIHGQDDPDTREANRSIAFWNEMRAEGLFISVLGCDDAHRRNFGWDYPSDFNRAYTLVFSKDRSFGGFAGAVRNGYTTAVENYAGAPDHAVGTYRMTGYALFLLEEYFPYHDELCFEEGCRLRDAYLGDSESLAALERISGRVDRYRKRFFGCDL